MSPVRTSSVVTVAACAVLLGVISVLGVVLLTSDGAVSEAGLADDVPPRASASAEPSPSAAPSGAPSTAPTESQASAPVAHSDREPEVVTWGSDGEVLSIVVRNSDARTLLRSRVMITALDTRGRTIIATSGQARAKCCTIVGLAPGEEFGLFLNTAVDVSAVDDVTVRYLEPEFAEAGSAAPGTSSVTVGDATLTRERDDAVVTATLTATDTSYVAGQAFLVDADEALVAVISGRFYCFDPGQTREVRMELTRPVPHGTRLQKVVAHPVPPGAPTAVADDCS